MMRSRRTGSEARYGGWILAEAVLAMALLSLLIPAALDSLVAASRHAARVSTAAPVERPAEAAKADLRRLRAEGLDEESIANLLGRRYPELDIAITGGRVHIAEEVQ